MRIRKSMIVLIPLAGLLLGGAAFFIRSRTEPEPAAAAYKTAKIERGNIEEIVSSNGSLKAVGTVDVLTQVTGTLESVYVDFNDRVSRNQQLARINTDKLRITLKEAEAALAKARAQSEYDAAEYEKSRALRERSLISDSDLAAKRLADRTAKANLLQAEAAYEEARLDIDSYAVILSPIDGIVLDRAVDPGQTVVGSGSTNTKLFTLAENLKTMEIEAAVDEMDIGRIKLGQEARFTVEAYPDKKLLGTVRQIRVVPTTSSNVVSYTVIVRADNGEGLLLPGMTATLEFLISQKKDVALVPSAALRFTPSAEVQAAARRRAFEERIADRPEAERETLLKQYDERTAAGTAGGQNALLSGRPMMPPPGGGFGPGAGAGAGTQRGAAAENRKTLWLQNEDGSVSLRMVSVGSGDGTNTELLDGDALVGKSVIVRAQ